MMEVFTVNPHTELRYEQQWMLICRNAVTLRRHEIADDIILMSLVPCYLIYQRDV